MCACLWMRLLHELVWWCQYVCVCFLGAGQPPAGLRGAHPGMTYTCPATLFAPVLIWETWPDRMASSLPCGPVTPPEGLGLPQPPGSQRTQHKNK